MTVVFVGWQARAPLAGNEVAATALAVAAGAAGKRRRGDRTRVSAFGRPSSGSEPLEGAAEGWERAHHW